MVLWKDARKISRLVRRCFLASELCNAAVSFFLSCAWLYFQLWVESLSFPVYIFESKLKRGNYRFYEAHLDLL